MQWKTLGVVPVTSQGSEWNSGLSLDILDSKVQAEDADLCQELKTEKKPPQNQVVPWETLLDLSVSALDFSCIFAELLF